MRTGTRRGTTALLALIALLAIASSASAVTITEFSNGIGAGSGPSRIAAGPGPGMWFTERAAGRIGRITALGVVTEYSDGITAGVVPHGIVAGPDGNMWFTALAGNLVGRIAPDGTITAFDVGVRPVGTIADGPDGRLWFPVELADTRPGIAAMTPSGEVTTYGDGLDEGALPRGIAAGPDGNLWFTDANDAIGRITPAGAITVFGTVTSNSVPFEIAAGPDGNLWFTQSSAGRIGRITPAGVVTEFASGISANARPTGIVAGPDGAMWFTEADAGKIARITTAGVVTEYSAGLSADSRPMSIAPDADGALWFTDQAGRIGRVAVLEAPVVTASAATVIGETGATLNGTVDARETPASAYFEYGTTTSYGASTPVETFDGAIATAASAALTGLQPATTYHFRLVATSIQGTAQATGTLTTQGTPPDTTPPGTASDMPPAAATVIDVPLAPLAVALPSVNVLQPATPVATRLSLAVARRGRVYDGRVRVGCRLDAGALAFCSVAAYANNRRVGTVARTFAAGRVGTVRVKLTARGRRLARRPGGVRLTYRATAVAAAGGLLRAKASSRVADL